MGVVFHSTQEQTPYAPKVKPVFKRFEKQGRWPAKLPAGIKVCSFTEAEFRALPWEDIRLVLVAANKCVAHLDEDPDHGVTEDILDRVIDITLREIKARVSSDEAQGNQWSEPPRV
jgi:hypothetical protein